MKYAETIRAEIKCQDGKAEVYIYGVIGNYWGEGGISADQFRQDIEALGDVDLLTVRINSPGGAVHDGITMFNALRRMTIPTIAAVDGLAASAAFVLAMGADTIQVAESGSVMIHEAMGVSEGRAHEHRVMAGRLEATNDTQAKIFSDKSGLSIEAIKAMLTEETWFNGPEALAIGFANEVTEPLKIAACIPPGHFKNTPKNLILVPEKKFSRIKHLKALMRPSEGHLARKKALDTMGPTG